MEYIWKMCLFSVGLILPFFSVIFQLGKFEVEDLEVESLSLGCAHLLLFSLTDQQYFLTSCYFRYGLPTMQRRHHLGVQMQVTGHTPDQLNQNLLFNKIPR